MSFTTRPELAGTFGMVASTHWIASAVGMGILERGGNAFDAAVAAGFALQVIEPHLNGPGGEAPLILHSAERDEIFVVDGQGVAPAAATIAAFRERGHDLIPGRDIEAACVPGAVGAWLLVLSEFGSMTLRDVLTPAIELAGRGFPLVARIARTIESVADVFCHEWPTSAEVYLAQGPPKAGDRFSNAELAATFERILTEAERASSDRDTQIEAARAAFYDGFVADAIDDFVRAGDGFLSANDMSGWRAALLDLRPGQPGGRTGIAPPLVAVGDVTPVHLRGAGEPTRGDTCHVDVVDREGNMVAATPSGGWLQSSPVVPGLGFPLGTRMQVFWLDEAHPTGLAPGKRPRTTLTPSLALRDGEPYLAFGTPGGDTQDQWSFNFFLNHAVFGMNLQEAIDAPMFHTNHFPSSFFPRAAAPGQIEVEGRVDAAVIDELRRRGHEVVVAEPWSLGRLSTVARDGDLLKAAANPRGMQGYAVGR